MNEWYGRVVSCIPGHDRRLHARLRLASTKQRRADSARDATRIRRTAESLESRVRLQTETQQARAAAAAASS